ncbi:hypothetical protein SASPL_144564 [Salvia splendens]|uniref:Uncharacterized protein n=1 Tax=Salvia splendens TaxID=180675 RepID=A0A8X8Z7A0_SALSN|nr:uncharacterized protein LOC121775441 [Salvia splendens]KAG6393988.1 hypothetical protein SASPL_144564 [Salvia splendens]
MNSLFIFFTALYTLTLLYFPSLFSRFLLSPVALSTLALLLYLLRLGAAQRSAINRIESDLVESDSTQPLPPHIEEFREVEFDELGELQCRSYGSDLEQDPRQLYVEWDVRAPLEVIHEEYEGEDAADDKSDEKREAEMNSIRRYASLSLIYPESDSDDESSSEGESPESAWFRWEVEEEDREGLIEIALDEKRSCCEVEEDNLIEIDLSPER